MSNKKKSIFCKNCKWYRNSWFWNYPFKCIVPKNKIIIREYDREYETREDPWELNKNNDCKLFEEK